MDIKRARVVVVEDESVMSTFILNSLRRLGILDLYAFADGATALREVIKLKPDLILTDVHMQPVGGIEFVRQLRALPNNQLSNTKVIFLSADSSMATVGEALPLGVSGYIVKPPVLNALGAKIEQALNS
jgi:CheY-like chemotaxis protein